MLLTISDLRSRIGFICYAAIHCKDIRSCDDASGFMEVR